MELANIRDDQEYWNNRYSRGESSGFGSMGRQAKHKAKVINEFAKSKGIQSVIEFGCGDGSQLSLYNFSNYTGFDISEEAIECCRNKGLEHDLRVYDPECHSLDRKADLSMSVDVIYHLTTKEAFEAHMRHLFDASDKFVLIYSFDENRPRSGHIRGWKFSDWVNENQPNFALSQTIPGLENDCDFFIYRKKTNARR